MSLQAVVPINAGRIFGLPFSTMDPYITGYTNFRHIFTSPFYNGLQHYGEHYFRPITNPIAFEYRKQYDLRCAFFHALIGKHYLNIFTEHQFNGHIARNFFYLLPGYEHAFHIQFI